MDLTGFFPLNETIGAVVTASFVLLLYLAAYLVIYPFSRKRIEALGNLGAAERPKKARPPFCHWS